jgi:selenide,water dikinase
VTGFGLLGHLGLLCRESGVGAEIHLDRIPVLGKEVWDLIALDCIPGGSRQNLETANEITEWDGVTDAQKALVSDAQTSGGLLLCVPPGRMPAVQRVLKRRQVFCAVTIGVILRASGCLIRVRS